MPRSRVLCAALLACLSLSAPSAPASDAVQRSFDAVPQVTVDSLLANPRSMMFAPVRFRCTFAEVTDLFDYHHTDFRPERFTALAVWPERARLWQPETRAEVLTSLYIAKEKMAALDTAFFAKYRQLEMCGVVKSVIDGIPQIEVTAVRPVLNAGAFSDAVIYHVEQAQALLNDGARDLAESHYVAAMAEDIPVSARIEIGLMQARNAVESARFEPALTLLLSLIETARGDVALPLTARSSLLALTAKAEIELAERGDASRRESAVSHARAAQVADPSNGEAYAVLGIALAGLDQYEEARRQCDNAVRLRPMDAEVRWYLGRILDRQGRGDEAIEVLKRAIDLTPKNARIHKSIAAAYRGRALRGGTTAAQDLATALREYEISLRLDPSDAEVQMVCGAVIEDAARVGGEILVDGQRRPATVDLAIAAYRKVLAANASSVPALKAIANVLISKKRFSEAVDPIQKLRALGAVEDADALAARIASP